MQSAGRLNGAQQQSVATPTRFSYLSAIISGPGSTGNTIENYVQLNLRNARDPRTTGIVWFGLHLSALRLTHFETYLQTDDDDDDDDDDCTRLTCARVILYTYYKTLW